MRVIARRQSGFANEIEIEGGHKLMVDEPLAAGGTDTGPAPTRLLAASLAACSAITIEMYAGRKGWDVGAMEVEVEVNYEDSAPSSFEVVLRLPNALTEAEKERLLVVAAHCPVHRILSGDTQVSLAERVEAL